MSGTRATRVELSYFSRSVVTTVAEERGIFAGRGLDVRLTPVSSSPHQFRLLRDGDCDLALTSPDNVLAYGGGDRNPLGERLDVRMLLGVDGGLGLSVLSTPAVASLADLEGRRVGVDVPQSGFALALFAILSAAGLEPGADYEVVSLGSTPQRRLALLAGECDATLLNAGHDLAAELAGCNRLAEVTDRYHPYLGAVLAATGPWIEANADVGRRFVEAWSDAVAVVLDPRERSAMVVTAAEALGLGEPAAERFVGVLASASHGLVRGGRIDPAALGTVLRIRRERAPQDAGTEVDTGALVDERFVGAGDRPSPGGPTDAAPPAG